MKQVISLCLPSLATDRLSRRPRPSRHLPAKQPPSVLVTLSAATAHGGGQRVAGVSAAARAAGIGPGLPLANARALLPGLDARPADAAGEARDLRGLASACRRYTPWVAVDPQGGGVGNSTGGGGLWLEVTGCTHLFGGPQALLGDLLGRLEKSGYAARAALAPTPGAAWALARFALQSPSPIVAPAAAAAAANELRALLAPLPVAALRLDAASAEGLERVGLGRIGDLMDLPRAPLTARFGGDVARRLDQALGHAPEPISPDKPRHRHQVRLVLAEPIGRVEDARAALAHLIGELCTELRGAHLGARRLEAVFYRVDNSQARLAVGTSRPARDRAHLARLFEDKLEDLDPGFGIEVVTLEATRADPFGPRQGEMDARHETEEADGAARLVDRLIGRFGAANVARLAPRASHIPERAMRRVSALQAADGGEEPAWRNPRDACPARPPRLLPQPTPIEVIAPVPDGPPVMFRWRSVQYRVAGAEGPERIAPEWWRLEGSPPLLREAHEEGAIRDYYRIEDEGGRRYWVYREGLYRPDRPPAWYLHGFFA